MTSYWLLVRQALGFWEVFNKLNAFPPTIPLAGGEEIGADRWQGNDPISGSAAAPAGVLPVDPTPEGCVGHCLGSARGRRIAEAFQQFLSTRGQKLMTNTGDNRPLEDYLEGSRKPTIDPHDLAKLDEHVRQHPRPRRLDLYWKIGIGIALLLVAVRIAGRLMREWGQ